MVSHSTVDVTHGLLLCVQGLGLRLGFGLGCGVTQVSGVCGPPSDDVHRQGLLFHGHKRPNDGTTDGFHQPDESEQKELRSGSVLSASVFVTGRWKIDITRLSSIVSWQPDK